MDITTVERADSLLAQDQRNRGISNPITPPIIWWIRNLKHFGWSTIAIAAAILLTVGYLVVYGAIRTTRSPLISTPILEPPATKSAHESITANSNIGKQTFEPPSGISIEPTFVNGHQFLVIGPVDLEVIDKDGNRTGIDENHRVELNAVSTSYTEIGDTKAIFVRGHGTYTANIRADEPGVFDLRLRTVRESNVERFVYFADVPLLSVNSVATLIHNTDIETPDDLLELDQDGDGVYETTLLPTSDIESDTN
jgi:hypothetical protein